jgi:hypothetical protein
MTNYELQLKRSKSITKYTEAITNTIKNGTLNEDQKRLISAKLLELHQVYNAWIKQSMQMMFPERALEQEMKSKLEKLNKNDLSN